MTRNCGNGYWRSHDPNMSSEKRAEAYAILAAKTGLFYKITDLPGLKVTTAKAASRA